MAAALKALVFALAGCFVLPFVLTQLILTSSRFDSEKQRREWKILLPGTALNLLGNVVVIYVVLFLAFRDQNPLNRLLPVLQMQGNYQDITVLATAAILCVIGGILGGFLLRIIFCREDRLRITRGRIALICVLSILCFSLAMGGCSIAFNSREGLSLREICRKTTVRVIDPKDKERLGSPGDEISYVTVRNTGILDYAAPELWLSESEDDLRGYCFRDVLIPAGKTARLAMDYDHGLDLKKSGGTTVFLSDRYGMILDSVKVPALEENQSYLVHANEAPEIRQLGNTVPQQDPGGESVAAPRFSHESGFYTEGFVLAIEAEPGTKVHYTVDCSTPTGDSPVYDGPIAVTDPSAEPNRFRCLRNIRYDYLNQPTFGEEPVEKALIVRAVAENEAGRLSSVVTKTYFINQDRYRQWNVISLVADPDDLFGSEGIYVTGGVYDAWTEANREAILALPRAKAQKTLDENGNQAPSVWDTEPTGNFDQQGYEWERPAEFTMWKQGELVLDQPVGIRIQGHGTRRSVLKRFSIYSRKEYSGSRYFDTMLFGERFTHSMVTREGTLHALSQTLAEGRDLLTTPYIQVQVFLDGEFWYTRFLHEKASERLIASTCGVNEENVVIVKNGQVSRAAKEGDNPFPAIYEYLEKHDLSRPEDYEGFGKILDLQSYIDSCCFQTYLANMDYKEKWNNYFWHTSEWENDGYGDTRWRMGLIDMDLRWKESAYSAQMEHLWEIDPFTVYGTWQKDVKAITEWPIFSALRKNADFCRQFALTYMDLINTAFVPEHVLAILEDIGETDEGILDFFRYRPEYAAAAMAKEFGLTGNRVPVILEISDPAAGEIRLNTIVPDLTQGSWSGEYYTDYPIRLMAREREGWTFSHWELNGEQAGTDAEKEIKPGEDGMTLRAVFTETAGQRQEGDERE